MAIYRLGIVCLLSQITQWLHVAIYRPGIVCLLSQITQWLHVAIYRLGIVCLLSQITQWLHAARYRPGKYVYSARSLSGYVWLYIDQVSMFTQPDHSVATCGYI